MTASNFSSLKPGKPPSASNSATPSPTVSEPLLALPLTVPSQRTVSLRLPGAGGPSRSISAVIGQGKELNDFLQTPLGRGFATIFFLWFALSGWLFRCLIFATWILPFAGPLLIGTVANNLVIKGSCPACKRQLVGYKKQVVRCTGCGNIVCQPKGDFFSGVGFPRSVRGNTSNKSEPDIIDVELEEK